MHPHRNIALGLSILAWSAVLGGCGKLKWPKSGRGNESPQGYETHGGDRLASIFVAKGYRVYSHLAELAPEDALLNPEQLDLFSAALGATRVDPVDTAPVDAHGDVVDAATSMDPQFPGRKFVQLYRPRWEELFARGLNVYRLVFHEYLWVIGVDDTNYAISNRLAMDDDNPGGVGLWREIGDSGAPALDYSRVGDSVRTVFMDGRLYVLELRGEASCAAVLQGSFYEVATSHWVQMPPLATGGIGAGFSATAMGGRLLVWGGSCTNNHELTATYLNLGFVYDAAADSWTSVNQDGAPVGRWNHIAATDGHRVILWGGQGRTGLLTSGAVYDMDAGHWQALSEVGVPLAGRYGSALVAVDNPSSLHGKMFVWQLEGQTCEPISGLYDADANTWSPIQSHNAPPYPCSWSEAVWTGDRLAFLFRQYLENADGRPITGVLWDPATDTWTEIGANGTPARRRDAQVVWTGDRLIQYGGRDIDGASRVTGDIYDPQLDSWSHMAAAPKDRAKPYAYWTGTSLLIWGGVSMSDQSLRSGAIWTMP